jgi:diguanylate cyclase (GGDEF)-like protein
MKAELFTVADAMIPATETVGPADTVGDAAAVIKRRGLPALPVVDQGRVEGLVTPARLLLEPPERPVADVMMRGLTGVTPALSLLQAYTRMTHQGVEILPVVDGGKVIGLISATAILRARGQQTDPLTGLPGAAGLRAWASAALERGHEVAVVFVDLDNFRTVNKILGHVAGDDVLRLVARLLSRVVDDRTDLLCRYGGDEFAVATIRREPAAHNLAERIGRQVALSRSAGGVSIQVTASVGTAGGRRTGRRERAHVAAVVDDLLTLASRASTAAKEAKRSAGRRPA